MTAHIGSLGVDYLLKLESATTPGTFVEVGGMRATDMDHKNAYYDTTTQDGTRWKRQIEGGIKSKSISGGGVWFNETVQKQAIAVCEAGQIKNWQLVDADGNTWEGKFAPSGYKMTGNHDGVQEFSLTLESADEIEFTPGAAST
jgi:TP901-1 family phage major tail protein